MRFAAVIALAVLCSCAPARARSAAAGVTAPLRPSRAGESAFSLRGGASEPSDALLQATFAANRLTSSVLADATGEISALRKRVAGGEAVLTFGAKADELLADALNKFEAETPKGDAEVSALYQSKSEELRLTLMTSLEPVFVQQIVLLKDGVPCVLEPPRTWELLFFRDCTVGVPRMLSACHAASARRMHVIHNIAV